MDIMPPSTADATFKNGGYSNGHSTFEHQLFERLDKLLEQHEQRVERLLRTISINPSVEAPAVDLSGAADVKDVVVAVMEERAPTCDTLVEKKRFEEEARLNKTDEEQEKPSSFKKKEDRSWLAKTVTDEQFELAIAVVILLNAVIIGVEVDWSAQRQGESAPFFFYILQTLCVIVFVVELGMKLKAFGFAFFTRASRNVGWNWFDTFLVASSVCEVSYDLVNVALGKQKAGEGSNLSYLRLIRIVRITRLVRLFRIVRIIKFVRALSILISSIMSAFKSFVWAMTLLTLTMYFFAIVFSQAVTEELVDVYYPTMSCEIDDSWVRDGRDPCLALWDFWGTIPRAMFTLFEAITGGIDWDMAARSLGAVHPFFMFVFVVYIAFFYFAVLNVVTGVFCQSAIENAQHDRELMVRDLLSNKQMYVDSVQDQFTAMFEIFDRDNSGEVTIEEFAAHIKDPRVQAYFALLDLDSSDAFTLFKLLDSDGSNVVDAEEFVEGCLRLKGGARSIDLAKLSNDNRRLGQKVNQFMETVDKRFAAYASSAGHTAAQGAVQGVARVMPQVLADSEVLISRSLPGSPRSSPRDCEVQAKCSMTLGHAPIPDSPPLAVPASFVKGRHADSPHGIVPTI